MTISTEHLRIFKSVILLATTGVVISQQSPQSYFEIIPGNLVYFSGDNSRTGDSAVSHNGNSYAETQPYLSLSEEADNRNADVEHHYNKGNLRRIRFRKDQFNAERNNARRQGQQCHGVCRYIPDRDFCPTNILTVPSKVNAQTFVEDDYSDEESEEYDDYEDFDDRKTDKGKKRLSEQRTGNYTGHKGPGESLHVVLPSLTRYAIFHAPSNSQHEVGQVNPMEGGRKSPTKRRRRRRQQRQSVTEEEQIKQRPSALEQEILIRWDRVVERGPFIGGDIVVPEGVLLRPPNFRYIRKQWPNGEIPFSMDPSLNSCRENVIYDAMDEIEEKTCLRFVDLEDDRNYLDIRRAQVGCSSYVGMVGGRQDLNLSTGCFSRFTITHELMHALGFDHEQSRKDRNKYIDIDFDNVLEAKEAQFELNPSFTGGGFPYDIRSIMHYSAFLFAKDKCEPTIYPVNKKIDICELGMGNGKGGMTDCDVAKINKMYKCKGKKYPKKCKGKM